MRWRHSGATRTGRRADLQQARQAMLKAIGDCDGLQAERLQLLISGARHHRDLWQLRSEAFHLISLQHCQAIAAERIGGLLHLFEGWIESHELSRPA